VSPKTGVSPDGFLCKKLQTVWENLLGFPFRDVGFFDERNHAHSHASQSRGTIRLTKNIQDYGLGIFQRV
jgi:hypothetical protein